MFIKKGLQGPQTIFVVENYHVFGTTSPYFALVEHICFCIFIKHLIVLTDRDVARKGAIEKFHEKI